MLQNYQKGKDVDPVQFHQLLAIAATSSVLEVLARASAMLNSGVHVIKHAGTVQSHM
jgi:hypothetical protein